MTPSGWLLLADTTTGAVRTTFEWGRIQENSDWILPLAVLAVLMLFSQYIYRRDGAELNLFVRGFLWFLRAAVFVGLLVMYLEPQWRSERDVVRNSRTLILVDTSLSMGLTDSTSGGETAGRRRVDEVTAALSDSDLLRDLRRTHDVAVFSFAEQLHGSSRVLLEKPDARRPASEADLDRHRERRRQRLAWTATTALLLMTLLVIGYLAIRCVRLYMARPAAARRGGLLAGAWICGLLSLGLLVACSLAAAKGVRAWVGPADVVQAEGEPPATPSGESDQDVEADGDAAADEDVDWAQKLTPSGSATRLGLALRQLINEEGGNPLSGIILASDGGHNAGLSPDAVAGLARSYDVPIFPIGVGSAEQPVNVRVSDLVAPARAYPGDDFVVTGYLQAQGLGGRVVEVQLLSRETQGGANATPGTGNIETRQQIELPKDDGKALPVKFTLTPEEPGRRTYCFRVEAVQGDRDPGDNFREADVEVIDRKNKVLIFAGGPTREYRFLRTLLYRDRSTTVDVFLQTAQAGVSQEADKLLDDFPITREEMFDYDCVVALDPDWQDLSLDQIDLLETWVAEQGGGLIVVAGQVHAARSIGGWVEDDNMEKILSLYPVEFYRRFSVLEEGMVTAEEPWPLEFTREGLEAEYLWLEDDPAAGREAWAAFEGVYSYCPVRGPKPGATVLARFSDPRAGAGEQPVFFADQFYGSGRVFYIGSGEMWRLRRLDTTYFEQFYTKLIRHVSQGRLLRGSTRGVLLVGQDRYLLGNTVEVRAQLTDARLEPLSLPEVAIQVIHQQSGTVQTVTLSADPNRPGTYAGRFTVLEEGAYRLELPVPESDERLSRRIQVRVPRLEIENPQRNDQLLSSLAEETGGIYNVGFDDALNPHGDRYLVDQLKDRTTTEVLPQAPDDEWKEIWRRWMMLVLCGLVFLEWTIRRLSKLA